MFNCNRKYEKENKKKDDECNKKGGGGEIEKGKYMNKEVKWEKKQVKTIGN